MKKQRCEFSEEQMLNDYSTKSLLPLLPPVQEFFSVLSVSLWLI